jgi:hypothetical protein
LVPRCVLDAEDPASGRWIVTEPFGAGHKPAEVTSDRTGGEADQPSSSARRVGPGQVLGMFNDGLPITVSQPPLRGRQTLSQRIDACKKRPVPISSVGACVAFYVAM